MHILNKDRGNYFGWWAKEKNYKDYNCFSPLFLTKKQAINWYVYKFLKGKL